MKPPTNEQPWKVFGSSPLLDRIQIYQSGDRHVITSNGKALFSMDNNDMADLIDTLQKSLAVSK